MSEFKLPHVEDLTTNSKLPGQLTENFKAIEQEDYELNKAIEQEDYELKGLIKKATDDSLLALNRLDNIERILKKNGIEDYPE